MQAAIVLIMGPDKLASVDTTGIAAAFKLPPAEQAVCALLLDGLTSTDIADARNGDETAASWFATKQSPEFETRRPGLYTLRVHG